MMMPRIRNAALRRSQKRARNLLTAMKFRPDERLVAAVYVELAHELEERRQMNGRSLGDEVVFGENADHAARLIDHGQSREVVPGEDTRGREERRVGSHRNDVPRHEIRHRAASLHAPMIPRSHRYLHPQALAVPASPVAL